MQTRHSGLSRIRSRSWTRCGLPGWRA